MNSRLKGDLIEKNNIQKSYEFFRTPNYNDLGNSRSEESLYLLRRLCENSQAPNEILKDKQSIAQFLDFKKNGGTNFMYNGYSNPNFDTEFVLENTFNDNISGVQISGEANNYSKSDLSNRGEFDYRITFRNSDKITKEEAVAFINTLVKEANEREISLRAKNIWESDAFILYCDTDYLADTVKLLNDLATDKKYGELVNSATRHFGPKQPFSIAPNDNSYYGISMAHCELAANQTRGYDFNGGGSVDTFNGYMERALNNVYGNLYNKYGGNISSISVDEMYQGLINYHHKYMFGDNKVENNCPLWLNRRNYQELNSNQKKINYDQPNIDGMRHR